MTDKAKWRDALALRKRIEELEAENAKLNSIVAGNAVTVASLAMRVVEAEKLEADVAAAYRQGQRDMQERAAELYEGTFDSLASYIRALPIKEMIE